MQGMSFGPADLAASRRMKTTRVGGGHPGYRVIEDPDPDNPDAPRADRPAGPVALLDRAHGRRLHERRDPARSTARSATSRTPTAARRSSAPPSCSAASAPGRCTRRRSTIAKKVFSPDPEEVKFAKKVIEAIPDGRGVHMIDGKMQDDATWKQCKVMVDLAEMLAAKDPELAEAYGFDAGHRLAGRVPRRHALLRVRGARDRQARRASRSPTTASPRRRGGARDRRADRRPDRDQVAGADRRAHEGRRREVRRHARRGRRARRGRSSQLEINGHMPRGVLVDPKAEVKQEYYAGVVWDGIRKQPVMLFSDMGGIDIEQVAEEHPDHVGRGHFSNLLPLSRLPGQGGDRLRPA